jgi:hypothetical protein
MLPPAFGQADFEFMGQRDAASRQGRTPVAATTERFPAFRGSRVKPE